MKQWLSVVTPLLALVLVNNPAQAQEETEQTPWYEVELLVFTQNTPYTNSEYWHPIDHISLSENVVPLEESTSLTLPDTGKNTLPVSTGSMKQHGYRILFHKTWHQALLPKESTQPIHIQGGNKISDTLHELDGEISLDIARYLHLRTQLFYSSYQPGAPLLTTADTQPADESSPLLDAPLQDVPMMEAIAEGGSLTEENTKATSIQIPPGYLTVFMEQGRRMRGDEIHYLDHPLFGLIIRLTRVEAPATPLTTQTTGVSTVAAQPQVPIQE